MLFGTLGSSLLGNLLTGKGIYRAGKDEETNRTNRTGKGIVRADYGLSLASSLHNKKMDF